jgi:hypothetical protein
VTTDDTLFQDTKPAMRAAIVYARGEVNSSALYSELRDAFMAGALWQAEQDKLAVQQAIAGTDSERRARDRDA